MSDSDEGPDLPTSGDAAYFTNVLKPGVHDVLCGRGGGTNNHSGNVKFRQLVNGHKLRYLAASKVEKPKVAREVVKLWRALDPPGRFLARTDDSKRGPGSVKAEGNVWYDVGDKKGREKASQCLRERTADVLPYVREMQRQQDYMTGQGLRMVEQQMRQHQENQLREGIRNLNASSMGSALNGPNYQVKPSPVQVHSQSISDPEMANAFSDAYFFNHGFQNNPQAFASHGADDGLVGAADPLSLHQMSRDQQAWNTGITTFETSQDSALLTAGFQRGTTPRLANKSNANDNIRPDPVHSVAQPSILPDDFNFDGDDDDECTFEEYRLSMREFQHLVSSEGDSVHDMDARIKPIDDTHEGWLKSFHTIESLKMDPSELDHSASSFSDLIDVSSSKPKPPPAKKKQPSLDSAFSRQKLVSTGQSTRTMQTSHTSGTMLTTGTQKSTKSQKSSLSAAFSTMSGVSMFSGMSEDTRLSKMSAARGLQSNLSMMSELTDLSETLHSLDLQTKASKSKN